MTSPAVVKMITPMIDQVSLDQYKKLHGQMVKDKAYRFTTFLKDENTDIFDKSVSPILLFTGGGAVAGLMVGAATSGPPGMGVGAGVGAAAGFVAGCIMSVNLHKKSYNAWLKQNRNDETFKNFLNIYTTDKFTDLFLCPITLEPIKEPMITPNGQVYDKSSIERWLKDHGNTDPLTRAPLTIKDLRPDNVTLGKHCRWLKDFLEKEHDLSFYPSIVRKGVIKLKESLEQQALNIFEREMKILNDALVSKKITLKEFTRQMTHLQKVLDGEFEES